MELIVVATVFVFILVVAEMPAIVAMIMVIDVYDFLPHPHGFTSAIRRCHRDTRRTANSTADN
ncbi:MAG: hypothetical protein Q8S05_01275, partial [Sulfuricella sp.]|nr:hypothetical protein [Sulfuricella sp.]